MVGMDKVERYRSYIREVLSSYASLSTGDERVRREVLFDTEHDRYQLLIIGWKGHDRFHSIIIHVDIIEEQLWIQYDMTETGVANDFEALGVPKEDIVLAFYPPYKWKYTGYGNPVLLESGISHS